MLNQYEVDRSQVEHEACAKIFWGDFPEIVCNYLLGQRVSYEEAKTLVDLMIAERAMALRGIGFRKIQKARR